jgi:hypothetical protein
VTIRAIVVLTLLVACRPPEDAGPSGVPKVGEVASRDVPMEGSGGQGGGPAAGGEQGQGLSQRGLGKEDFALIEAELRCVGGMYKADPAAKTAAEAGVLARYGANQDWIERVRVHMESEPDVSARMEEIIGRRMAQVCADGKLSPELLAAPPAGGASPGAPATGAPGPDAAAAPAAAPGAAAAPAAPAADPVAAPATPNP